MMANLCMESAAAQNENAALRVGQLAKWAPPRTGDKGNLSSFPSEGIERRGILDHLKLANALFL